MEMHVTSSNSHCKQHLQKKSNDPDLCLHYATSLLQLKEQISNSPEVSSRVVMQLNVLKPALLPLLMNLTQTLFNMPRLSPPLNLVISILHLVYW